VQDKPLWYSWKCRITTESTLQKLGLRSTEVYTAKRQLQRARHVARMGEHRLPRKMLTTWCYSPRPNGRPESIYGESLKNALKLAKVDPKKWYLVRAGARKRQMERHYQEHR
jgi:hypothetical protein